MKKAPGTLRVLAGALVALALATAMSVQTATIDPRCNGAATGAGTFATWAGHFLDGGRLCDAESQEHGGTSGADGVSAMDFDGDCDLDLITGWEESGKVFIYLNPTLTVKPAEGCPVKHHADNTQLRSDAIARQWPLIEVTRDGHPNAPFLGVEDAVFADNDRDGVADYVVIATEAGRMKTFVSFPTRLTSPGKAALWQWHTFDLGSGDEFFMRAVIGDIDNQGCPDVLVGSKTTDSGPTGDIRWWTCPLAGWEPQLWKTGTALPDFEGKPEADYFRDLWGEHHLIATDIEWIMEMNIVNLVPGANPNSSTDYNEVLFTDRRKVGYMYLVDPGNKTANSSWRLVNIDNPDGSAADFRWYWLGQLVDSDGDGNLELDDPDDPPEIVAAYNEDVGRGVFARWYERGAPMTIKLDGKPITVNDWARYEVVVDGKSLPWGNDKSTDDPTRQNKATGIADVDGDGHPEIIATIRGSNFSGAFYLKPESGVEPPRCLKNACSDSQEWVIHRITPQYDGNIKYDNLVLVDADLDCDIDVFSVEENGVGDYGLGTVWYENTLPQGSANQACSASVVNHAPTLTAAQTTITAPEGSLASNSGAFGDIDNEGVTITASFGSVVADADAGTWRWSYTPADGPVHNRALTLTATDARGSSTSLSLFLEVVNVSPTVGGLIVGPHPADVGEGVSATATFGDPAGALDAPYRCIVNYGDGSGDQDGIVSGDRCNAPAHAYTAAGSYTVVMTLHDKDDGVGSLTATALVTNVPPVISAPVVSPGPSAEGKSVSVSAGFSDRGVNGPYTCSVNYGDGSGAAPGAISAGVCSRPTHTYDDNGGYQITVMITDKSGVSGSATQTHQVSNVAPTGVFAVAPSQIFIGESAQARFSQISDPSGADTAAGFSYRYDCNSDDVWDGSGQSLTSFACRFTNGGTFTVVGQIRDKDDGQTRYSAVVTVLTPQQALRSLIDDVIATGVLNRGRANSLTSKLENATASLNRGNPIAAVNQLEAFAHEVEAFTKAGTITGAQSQLLLNKARRVIDAVRVAN